MRNLTFPLILAALLGLAGCATTPATQDSARWAAYYAPIPHPALFAGYDLLVVEDGTNPPLSRLKSNGTQVLAYVALCEITDSRPYFADAKRRDILLGAHPSWPENHRVDIRSDWWQSYVADTLAPALMTQGYDGLMFDTLDSCADLAQAKKDNRFVTEAAAVIHRIRQRYPSAVLMANRGFPVAEAAAKDLNILLAESTLADHDLKTGRSTLFPREDRQWSENHIRRIRANNPAIRVFSLDYWPLDDHQGIADLYRIQRAKGYAPYVTTSDLTTLGPVF